jgi:hypothetical protein
MRARESLPERVDQEGNEGVRPKKKLDVDCSNKQRDEVFDLTGRRHAALGSEKYI